MIFLLFNVVMKFGKSIFLFFVIFSLNTGLFAQKSFSSIEEDVISKTVAMRFETRKCSTADEAIKKIDSFSAQIKASAEWSSLGEQAKLTFENMIVQEKYSYIYEKNEKDPQLKNLILNQYNKIIAWNEAHPAVQKNKWYVLSSGDVINSSMQYISQSLAIKYGLQEKDDYDALVNEYPDFSFALINSALWYYYAPAIGGGSTKKAADYFKKAFLKASSDYEKYYAAIYMSQICYENKDTATADFYLKEAEKLTGGDRYVKFIKKLNANNFSLFYYINNREKVEKKLQ